jgi:hypothetical protein
MSASLRQEFVSEFKAFYKLDKKKHSSALQQPDDASIDSNVIIKGGGVGGGEKENNSTTNNNKMKIIDSSSSPTKSIEYFNNPPGRQKLIMETGGKWTMASNRGPNAILSPAAATATSSDDNSSTRNNDNVSISRSNRSNGNRSSKSQDETLWKEFKHEFVAYYMKKPAIVLSLDDSYEIEQQEEEKEKDRRSESIPRELSFEERYSKMYKLHTQNTGVDVAEQEVVGVGNVQEEEEEEEVEGDDPALLLQ